MVEGDAVSDLPRRVEAAAREVDLLLWDVVDERLGVHVHEDGGITTDTVESRTQRGTSEETVAPPGTRHVAFGSDEHFALFEAALPAWRAVLERTGLLERTVLVAPPWAAREVEGGATPPSFGLSADEGNALFRRYLAAARDQVGVRTLGQELASDPDEVPEQESGYWVHSLSAHQWGPAPFHYDDATYLVLAGAIAAAAREWCHPSGWDGAGSPTRVPSALERDPALRYRIEPSAALTLTAPGELTVELTAPPLKAWAFHLYRDGERVATTTWGRTSEVTFATQAPGIYRCRAILLPIAGDRLIVVSAPVRVT